MEIIYQDSFVCASYDASSSVLLDVWTTESDSMSAEEFKKFMFVWRDAMQLHHIKYALTDTLNFKVALTPELQVWIVENITAPTAKNFSFQKQAFIMPVEFIANLSIEQFAEESNAGATQTRYFSDMTSARKWLLE
jgi:hypothetical protein